MKREIVIERVYPHPPNLIWQAITDREILAEWLMPNDFEPRVGHKFQFRWKPQPGWRGIVDCEVLGVEPPRRLAYTWEGHANQQHPTVVSWTLTPAGAGTRLRFQHTGFEGMRGLIDQFILNLGAKRMYSRALPAILARLAAGSQTTPANEHR